MSLLKPIENGRMYPGWWRWNPIAGCEHRCSYCYLKAMGKRFGRDMMTPTGLREDYLNDELGSGRKIFVGSSGDMWGDWVLDMDIKSVLECCFARQNNKYMFLTKNPFNYSLASDVFHNIDCILGATVETDDLNISQDIGCAPDPLGRLEFLRRVGIEYSSAEIMISIEPVMKFSEDFWKRIEAVDSEIVYIGVDSGKNGLPEPTRDELIRLIIAVNEFTDLRLKKGIERIVGADWLASWQGERGMKEQEAAFLKGWKAHTTDIKVIREPCEPEPVACEGGKL